jgi:hypothetical protein
MINQAPNIDDRASNEIAQEVQSLLQVYTPEWKEFDPVTKQPTGVSAALIGIFARFAEVIIQRLNEAPEKNFLAFLDLLGASRLPPQPARVPLTFSLAAGAAVDGLVLAGTQVAAPPAKSEKEPVVFETERELVVTAAQLTSLFVRDPEQDQQADRSPILTSAFASGALAFQGDRLIDHILYIGHSRLFGFSHITNITLTFILESDLEDPRDLSLELWNGIDWEAKTPGGSASNLMNSGIIRLGQTLPIPESLVNEIQSKWLRIRLLTPITIANAPRLNMVRATDLPRLRQLGLSVDLQRGVSEGLSPDVAFTNAIPIELGKDFFPFGEKPRLNDALYLASAEAFSKDSAQGLATAGAAVQLDIDVTNSPLFLSPTSVRPSPDLQLAWECWNGNTWQHVGASGAPDWLSMVEVNPTPTVANESALIEGKAQKGTALFIQTLQGAAASPLALSVKVGEDGQFAMKVPAQTGLNLVTITAILNGQLNRAWVTFFAGNAPPTVSINVQLPTRPVDTPELTLSPKVEGATANQVKQVRISNGHANLPVVGLKNTPLTIPLFEGRNDLLIEGLSDANVTLAARTVTVGRRVGPPTPDPATGFVDGTHALCQSGIVVLTLPNQVAVTTVSGQENFWLRVRIIRGDYGKEAGYRLKKPEAPDEGFTLTLETFRPPVISGVRIGYRQSLSGLPEVMLADNNSTFERVTNATGSFEPFRRAPEDRPTLYAGFTLPANRPAFPNSPISLYAHVEGLKYGEKAAPISPDRSKEFAAPSAVASHRFFVTNIASTSSRFEFETFGTRWQPPPAAPVPIEIPPSESRSVDVLVTVPEGAPPGSRDQGFLQLSTSSAPGSNYTAAFITFAGAEIVTGEQLRLVWEYWNGKQWYPLTVRDDTENFTRPSLVEFLAPPDFSVRSEFGLKPLYWLRVRWEGGEYTLLPRLRRLLLNTTLAAQTVTIRNETLGSSDGSGSQKFRSTKAPILFGQSLEVREPEMPSAAELESIIRMEGEDAVTRISDAAGRPREIWVRWHEVSDFYGSGPRDRHYMLEHLTGEIRTGDGLNGLIPPVGIGNVRLARYQIGGGSAGNKPAGAVVQLKTTVPYVDKVINAEDAAGGADAETLDSLLARAPRTIRHRGRAVTLEDYEDLAMLASPAVARAKCIPLRNLIDDPLDERPTVRGEVSVIIVPRSPDAKPVPTVELLSRVQDYLEAESVPTSRVSVVGPHYIRIDVNVEIALASLEGASLVQQATQEKIAGFLHPLTGGLDGAGWDFGRKAHLSDLYALIENVPGVDHIRALQIAETEETPGVKATGRFLVFSGTHTISLVF